MGLSNYNSTTGLDFNRYINNVNFFLNKDYFIFDSQGTIYFFLIAKYYQSLENVIFNDYRYLNNVIQFINFIFYGVGLLGLYLKLRVEKIDSYKILISFIFVNFLPTAYYFRLTMKPEIVAFAIFPWLFLFIDRYIKNRKNFDVLILTILFSIIFTLKASISGMVILSILLLYFQEIKKVLKHLKLLMSTLSLSLILTFLNFKLMGRSIFSKPYNIPELSEKWNNTANFSFFYKLDLFNLIANPYKHLHAESFLAITLLDTTSDYFTFFWNHNESGNYFQLDRIQLTNNFLVQNFLPQYASIAFTLFFYLASLKLIKSQFQNYKVLIFPIIGILVLIINSFGIPSKNFDPSTGDLFKVHYYSFLFAYAFVYLIVYLTEKLKFKSLILIVLLPVFLVSLGFPKTSNYDKSLESAKRLNISEFCLLSKPFYNLDC